MDSLGPQRRNSNFQKMVEENMGVIRSKICWFAVWMICEKMRKLRRICFSDWKYKAVDAECKDNSFKSEMDYWNEKMRHENTIFFDRQSVWMMSSSSFKVWIVDFVRLRNNNEQMDKKFTSSSNRESDGLDLVILIKRRHSIWWYLTITTIIHKLVHC